MKKRFITGAYGFIGRHTWKYFNTRIGFCRASATGPGGRRNGSNSGRMSDHQ